jgi:glutamine amidotransferase-like uncharacterized protein
MKALSSRYDFKIFTKHELEDDFFDDVDILAFPGGFGDADSFDFLFRDHTKRIKNFVNNGGKYLGICMGGFWAGHHYFDLLDGIKTEQYIKRPNTDTRRPHAKNQRVLWNGDDMNMYFYDGCAFSGPGLNHSEIHALYPNGDAMALIQGNVGVIGCHPESEPHWYNSYSWMKSHYHNGNHHKLLLDFVDRLALS